MFLGMRQDTGLWNKPDRIPQE
ncbi:hypothetical protein VULLAG_LOCUS1911 [Vulpes lagopus]